MWYKTTMALNVLLHDRVDISQAPWRTGDNILTCVWSLGLDDTEVHLRTGNFLARSQKIDTESEELLKTGCCFRHKHGSYTRIELKAH